MSTAAERMPAGRLRVLVHAAHAARQDALRKLIAEAGYQSVDSLQDADVVLSDGEYAAEASVPVVALGGLDTEQAGLLDRDAAPAQIEAALAAVAAGLTVRSADGPRAGFGAVPEHSLQTLLTPREIEVLSGLHDGLTNKMIARGLAISLHTVKFHLESLFRKLGVRTRTEAVARAREHRRRNTVEL